ncbi:MAG TPA: 2-phospho-L-lactate transferase CofD family protein, partial [Candidatus Limnocylindrales bacterium]
AIHEADIVVLGPGSLDTSVLPVLLIPAIEDAVLAAPGMRIYACNVAGQPGETEGYDLADHVEALLRHTQPDLIDLVLANDRFGDDTEGDDAWPADAVRPRWPPAVEPVPHLATDAVASADDPHHHDPERLAAAILRVYERDGSTMRRERVARTA